MKSYFMTQQVEVSFLTLIDPKTKNRFYDIVFKSETKAGKAFDIMLILVIITNSLLVMAESVEGIRTSYGLWIKIFEWIFVSVFTLEYLFRIYLVPKKLTYLVSFFGIIDLMAILPVIFALVFPSIGFLVVIRIFRLLRIFSILKMGRYMDESSRLMSALKASKPKITVFLFTILFIVMMVGAMMYIIEGPENGFINIPESMYWAIVTVSTVGYGDISPQTPLGKLVSSLLMILAYGIIAVPTGIISQEIIQTSKSKIKRPKCAHCQAMVHEKEDQFCAKCGRALST
jgi:voltage-gated potassium channel